MISDGVIEFCNRHPPNQKRMLNCASYTTYLMWPLSETLKIETIHTSTIHVKNVISPIDVRVRNNTGCANLNPEFHQDYLTGKVSQRIAQTTRILGNELCSGSRRSY